MEKSTDIKSSVNVNPLSHLSILGKVELYTTHILVNELSGKIVYHNIQHTLRLIQYAKKIGQYSGLSDEELEITLIICWFFNTGMRNGYHKAQENSKKIALDFLKENDYPEEKCQLIAATFDHVFWGGKNIPVPTNMIEKVINDARVADICNLQKAEKQLRLIYQELLLNDKEQKIGKVGWSDIVLGILNQYTLYTPYGKEHLAPTLDKVKQKIQENRELLKKQTDKVLKKELNISKEELKKLRKQLSKISGRDERAITNLFRIVTKNQAGLLSLVDRKARILVAVNSIILSILIGDVFSHDGRVIKLIPIVVLVIASMISVIYAILSIRPAPTHGTFSEEEIREKGGNLLYFGNYHGMGLKDFEWAFLQMLNDSNYLHSSLIRDLYYNGQELQHKYKLIRVSLSVFLFGVVFTVVTFLYIQIRLLN
jgi:hypothetical protein